MKPVGEPDVGTRTSGSMSGERKRGGALRLYPRLSSTLPMMTKNSPEILAENLGDGYLGLRCVTSLQMRFCNNAPWTSKSASG